MTEIDSAIETMQQVPRLYIAAFEKIGAKFKTEFKDRIFQDFFLGEQALQEKAEREKGCPYCEALLTGGTSTRLLDPDARFCSRCGRKLEVPHENPI
jgi:hypothetical protein